jgi:hypothetical protein
MWNPVENASPAGPSARHCKLDREALPEFLWKTGGNATAVRKRTLDMHEFARKRLKKSRQNR